MTTNTVHVFPHEEKPSTNLSTFKETEEKEASKEGDKNNEACTFGRTKKGVNVFAREFGFGVSVVGARYVADNASCWWRRALWLCLVLFGVIFMIIQVQGRIRFYLSWPTTIESGLHQNSTVDFPTITICNENRIMKNLTDEIGATDLYQRIFPPWPIDDFEPDFSQLDDIYPNRNNMDWELEYRRLAHKLPLIVVGCEWQGQPCKMDWFEQVWTNAGYCIQFNSKHLGLQVSHAGAPYGLYMILLVLQSQYLATNSMAAGYTMMMHSSDDIPMVREQGFKLGPGVETLVKFGMSYMDELGDPWGPCLPDQTFRYSVCLTACLAEFVINRCDCKSSYMPGNVSVCDPQEYYECFRPAEHLYMLSGAEEACGCKRDCHSVHYGYSLSTAPGSIYALDFISNHVVFQDKQIIKNDYALVNIYPAFIEYEYREMKSSYSFLALLCDIGGALSLILGSTLLTFVEVLDFLVLILLSIIL